MEIGQPGTLGQLALPAAFLEEQPQETEYATHPSTEGQLFAQQLGQILSQRLVILPLPVLVCLILIPKRKM